MERIKNYNFYGMKLSSFSEKQLYEEIIHSITNNEKKIVYGYSIGTFSKIKPYPEIAVYSNQFDIMVADGRGYYLLARASGFPIQSDISIPNMVDRILEIANIYHYSVMLLGARKEINEQACEKLRKKYPGATILPGRDGYFNEKEEQAVVESINHLKPDVLLIGISSPKKERFAFKYKDRINVKIIIPCGGVIDILAGNKKRTPWIIKKAGLAWFYRFAQDPRRLFRDSVLNLCSVLFVMIPCLIIKRYILRNKKISIPEYFCKEIVAPISGLEKNKYD